MFKSRPIVKALLEDISSRYTTPAYPYPFSLDFGSASDIVTLLVRYRIPEIWRFEVGNICNDRLVTVRSGIYSGKSSIERHVQLNKRRLQSDFLVLKSTAP